MSYSPADTPICKTMEGVIELVITPRERDLGEFSVRRVLPAAERRMVGPFIFFDHMGPASFGPGEGIQVRPHPHIGIATITYLFDGQIMHRDSLGYQQSIKAGAVNLMTAGRGIVHSERAGDDLDTQATLHGIQSWIALPNAEQEREPSFMHYPEAEIPVVMLPGAKVAVIMGEAFGQVSPVTTYSQTLYLDCEITAGADLPLEIHSPELALYVVAGEIGIGEQIFSAGTMAVACSGSKLAIKANENSHVMVIGGAPVGKRHIWWNFVSSSKARIEQAKVDWQTNRFDSVPDDDEYIPLPE